MSAAEAHAEVWVAQPASHREWAVLSASTPQLAATMRRYLVQLTTFLAPGSVKVADSTLRQLARWLTAHTDVTVVAAITRTHIEDYKVWLAAQPGSTGPTLAKNTQRQRLRMIRIFLERLIEWDWPDAPRRNPILHGDIPPRPEPLPRFLNDQDAAKLMAAARAHRLPRYRLVVEMLARTGLRASELCNLAADAVTQIGDAHWLRVPVGKLRNDRFIPLHPDLVVLLAEWTAETPSTSEPRTGSSPITTRRSSVAPCIASSPPPPSAPGSGTCILISSVTISPPRRSTGGCASKRSPRSSVTARWR